MRKRKVCSIRVDTVAFVYSEERIAEKTTNNTNPQHAKDGEELEQVAGNAEDEIGERIAAVRETELLYGPESLLAAFGPMIVHICGSPHKYKVCSYKNKRLFSITKSFAMRRTLLFEPLLS